MFPPTLFCLALAAAAQHTPLPAPPLVNLNSASAAQLIALPHIGEARAEAIIAYRRRHRYRHASELLRIRGIGPRTYKKLKPLITVAPAGIPKTRT